MSLIPPLDIKLMQTQVPYHTEVEALFTQCCQHSQASLLLESSEIKSKQNLKSFMIIDSALRITANNNVVTIEALTENGQTLLRQLPEQLPDSVKVDYHPYHCQLIFPDIDTEQEEDQRLKSLTLFDLFRTLKRLVNPPQNAPYALFFAGLFSYDLVAQFEAIQPLPASNACPDLCIYLAETLLVIDHQQQQASLQSTLFSQHPAEQQRLNLQHQHLVDIMRDSPPMSPPHNNIDLGEFDVKRVPSNMSDAEYCDAVTELKAAIKQGDLFQVGPSRRFTLPCYNPLAAYRYLKQLNPSPYLFFLQDRVFTLFGASPESCLKFNSHSRQVELYPIAGTRRRIKGATHAAQIDLDSRIELDLRLDPKELSEHIMLVDLARNDIARISQTGSRYVAKLLQVDKYSHVMHLVSKVAGLLRPDLDALHAYQACMNMGTLTGAPKVRAMQYIADVEKVKRGSYGGAVGYFTGEGDLDSCIVIRSAYVENNQAAVQAGAGVVLDSRPQAEADETRQKAHAVLQAIYYTNPIPQQDVTKQTRSA